MRYLWHSILPVLICLVASEIGQKTPTNWVPLQVSAPKGMQNALSTGQKPITDVLHLSVTMPYRDPVGMQAFVDSVSDPKSPNYRHFLTPSEVGSRFGLSTANIAKVTNYLISKGIKIRLVGQNRISILADATVAQAQAAFNTSLEEFALVDQGKLTGVKRFSFTTPPNVPASIIGYISYIGGLENFTQPKARSSISPSQLRTLYSTASIYNGGYQGQGRTVAISNFDGYHLSNVLLEYSQFNLPSPPGGVGSNISIIPINKSNGQLADAHIEGDLDIQIVLATAPLCHLVIYDDAQDDNLISVLTQEADDNLADIVSESYGWEGDSTFYLAAHNLHLSLTAQGVTYIAASGDSGAAISGGPYPDIDPEVLIVGGTSVSTDNEGNREQEVGWNGSGGGWCPTTDPFNVLPTYQIGTGVPTNIPFRLVPDVAFDANPATGYQIFYDGSLDTEIGGTSCATPTFAGSLAICEQLIIDGGGLPANLLGQQRLGRLQDLLYSYNGDPTVFYDVTTGTNGYLPNSQPSVAGPGWDTVTGWGPVIFSGFVDRVLNRHGLIDLTVSPSTVTGGSLASGTVTIASPAPAGGLSVSLSSNNSNASVPASVTVPVGSTTGVFSISTIGSIPVLAIITASSQGTTLTATLAVNLPVLSEFVLSPTTVVGGNSSTGTITLNAPAPPQGVTVSLTSNNPGVSIPASVTIAGGALSVVFEINTAVVAKAATAGIKATLGDGTGALSLTILPADLTSLTVAPTSVQDGAHATGTLSLNGAAPATGLTILLSSNNVNATVPASVKIPSGSNSATFAIVTKNVAKSVTATITAKDGTMSETANLSILAPLLSGIGLSQYPIEGGNQYPVMCSVGLSGPAPASGIVVTLSSSNPKVAPVPASLKVPSGLNYAGFNLKTSVVSVTQTVTITARSGGVTQTTTFPVTPFQIASFTIAPTSVPGGSNATGVITVSGPPVTPIVIHLASSSPSVIVPATATVPVGSSTANFTIKTKATASGSTGTVTATLGSSVVQATLAVIQPTLLVVSVKPISVKGSTTAAVTGTVTISSPAPVGGLVILLSSSKASAASTPASVTIAAGSKTATFKVTHSKVTSLTSVSITGSLAGFSQSAALTVTP